ncbi:MAG: hypothetical protein M9916_00290 [Crocinitomicaceae bacterium]|nr:hypothetical protein [Crocinitomicaceae bacterium]
MKRLKITLNLILLTFFFSVNFSFVFSQVQPPISMPPCAQNDPPGNTVCTATPICNLNGYCGTTSSSYSVNYWPELL